MAYFYLYDSDIPATVSASAEISSSDNDSAVVNVTASGYIPAGYWIYSAGVVVTITINGQPSTTTLFGNGSYYYGSDGAKTATFSVDVPKGTGAKNVAWSVAFKRAMDGYVYDTAHTATGTIAVGALPSYTVSYNANGGSGAPSAQTKWYGSTLKLSTATPTRTGYSFLGWSTSNDSSVEYAAGANYTANAGVTLYAVWKANTYTVSYNANGGSGAPGNQTKTYGVNLTLSSTKPTRTNYNFLGWATSASATSPQYAAGGTYSANSGVTLYAVWQLAYTKPRINGLSVERCDADGNALEEGTYARVSFGWATDRAVSSITVTWTSVMGGSGSTNIPASGTSGNVSFVFGGGNLSADATYTVAVAVADSGGSTPASTTLSSIEYTIDFLAGGKGAAFGKAAEKEGVLENAWEFHQNGNLFVSGKKIDADLFAPSGYGLGVNAVGAADLNSCINCGWYWTSSDTKNAPDEMKYATCHVIRRTANNIVQELTGVLTNTGCKMIRITTDGGATWIEEWVNPPMKPGVEYRTTERYNGQPVYAKLVNQGAFTGTATIPVGNGYRSYVRFSAIAQYSGKTYFEKVPDTMLKDYQNAGLHYIQVVAGSSQITNSFVEMFYL